MPKPTIQKNTWEFLPKESIVPSHIRNASDPAVVKQYLDENISQLSPIEQQYLAHKQASIEKLREKTTQTAELV